MVGIFRIRQCDIHFLSIGSSPIMSYSYILLTSVNASDLTQLPDLETLELRGSAANQNFIFYIDEPMPKLKHVNFESVILLGDEKLVQNQPKSQHPPENFDYIPESQRDVYDHIDENDDSTGHAIEFVRDIEIVPYNVYAMQLEQLKRVTFAGWNDLEVLRIHGCSMKAIYFEMFDGLDNLQHISLENNGIRDIPQFAFYGALHARTLSLAQNAINDLHYYALAGLLELEYLDLSSNNLSVLSEMTFPPFPRLQTADLRENPIESILPMTFGIMNTTLTLTLGSSRMPFKLHASADSFLALDHLKELNLLNVSAGSLTQKMFVGLMQLQRLRVTGDIGRIEYDAFAEMPTVKELTLSRCGIVDISMDAFYGVKNLRVIDLSVNRLTQIPFGLFDEQRELEEIYLQSNLLRKLPENFFGMSTLKLARLVDNAWMCSCTMNKWNQAITNSVRLAKLSVSTDEHCVRNPKTGKIEFCDPAFDEFPRYSYGFDNSLSPLCHDGLADSKARDIYFTLRHNIKCISKRADKQRFKKNFLAAFEQSARATKYTDKNKAKYTRARRVKNTAQIIQRKLSPNARILNEQTFSNDIIH